MAGKRKAEVQRWLQQAASDLKAARWNIQGGFYDTACFLSQQAGEKALKSLLYYLGARRSALLTHSLVLHYIPSRYPNGLPSGYPHQFYCAVHDLGYSVSQTAQSGGESEEGWRSTPLGRARGEGRALAAFPARARAFPAN